MKYLKYVLFVSSLLLNAVLVQAEAIHQDRKAARATDVRLTAEATGNSIAFIDEQITIQEEFSAYVKDIIVRYPNEISAIWMDPIPSTRGHVRFVEDVPYELAEEIRAIEALNSNVDFEGYGLISMAEHKSRTEETGRALVSLGHKNLMVHYNPADNKIYTKIRYQDNAPDISKIRAKIRNRFRTDKANGVARRARSKNLEATDIEIEIEESAEPFVTTHGDGRGGSMLLDENILDITITWYGWTNPKCTAGWPMQWGWIGVPESGVVTAGHCYNMTHLDYALIDPLANPIGALANLADELTAYNTGYTTLGKLDARIFSSEGKIHPEFFADSNTIRSVVDAKATSSMVGSSICFYGRVSNVRTCGHTITSINASVTNADGMYVEDVVITSSTSSVTGDSGGGWSYGNTAWGINIGVSASGEGLFTAIQPAIDALDADLMVTGVQIKNAAGYCLDVAGGNFVANTNVQVWGCNNTAAQRWRFYSDGTIRTWGGNFCLDVAYAGTSNGTNVKIYYCNGNAAQQWDYSYQTTTYDQIEGIGGNCLDVAGGTSSNGTNIQMWACNGTSAQDWRHSEN